MQEKTAQQTASHGLNAAPRIEQKSGYFSRAISPDRESEDDLAASPSLDARNPPTVTVTKPPATTQGWRRRRAESVSGRPRCQSAKKTESVADRSAMTDANNNNKVACSAQYSKQLTNSKLFAKFVESEGERRRQRTPSSCRVMYDRVKLLSPGRTPEKGAIKAPISPAATAQQNPARGSEDGFRIQRKVPTCANCTILAEENSRLKMLLDTRTEELKSSREHGRNVLGQYMSLLNQLQQKAGLSIPNSTAPIGQAKPAAEKGTEQLQQKSIEMIQNEARLRDDELLLLRTENSVLKEDLQARQQLLHCLQQDYDTIVQKFAESASAAQTTKVKAVSDEHELHKIRQERDLLSQELRYAKDSLQSLTRLADILRAENSALRKNPESQQQTPVLVSSKVMQPAAGETGGTVKSRGRSATVEPPRTVVVHDTVEVKKSPERKRFFVQRQNESTIGELLRWDLGGEANNASRGVAPRAAEEKRQSEDSGTRKLRSQLEILRREEMQLLEKRAKWGPGTELERELEKTRINIASALQRLAQIGSLS